MITAASSAKRLWRGRRGHMLRTLLSPPPDLSISEWADRYRMLSVEASSEPGKWHTSRAPYQRGIMDALKDPMVEMLVCMTSSQVGKTEIVNNICGYYMDQDPSPVLVVLPTLNLAEAWSKDRLAPMLRDTPRLRGKIAGPRVRNSGNTLLHKSFSGGNITIVGANSAADLSGRPKRILVGDEIDRFPESAGNEGDPWDLAGRRTANFWNRKKAAFSTPTLKGFSRIESMFDESDQRHFHVPCTECGHMQRLVWAQLKWESGLPETAEYLCVQCGSLMNESQKRELLEGGEWISTAPFTRIAGFHLNALYSPWARWPDLVREWMAAQGIPQKLKVFVNTVLGETFEEAGERVDADSLAARREPGTNDTRDKGWGIDRHVVPMNAGLLTAAVDVQGDRLELKVKAWGEGEESWLVHYEQLDGDPGGPAVWKQLDALLRRSYLHESGAELHIQAACVDTGGHHPASVYRFTRKRLARVWAVKGASQPGKPVWGQPGRSKKHKARVGSVGTDTAKDLIFSRMRIREAGPGFMHIPQWADNEYLAQLTSEKVITKFVNGRKVRRYKKTRDRNEALDLEVYNLAALYSLGADIHNRLGKIVERVQQAGATLLAAAEEPETQPASTPSRTPRKRGSWVTGGNDFKIR